jgi:prepilin-type N-terminal cleavage/methylation domain-containing protein
MLNLPRPTGFTLIELLVTVAILLVITGGSIAAMTRFNDQQRVRTATEELQTFIRLAQDKARVRELPGSGCAILEGYRVVRAGGAPTLQLQAVCENPQSTQTIKTHTIPAGITVYPTDFTIFFPTLYATAILNESATPTLGLTVENSSSTFSYTFSVSASGAISVPATPTP